MLADVADMLDEEIPDLKTRPAEVPGRELFFLSCEDVIEDDVLAGRGGADGIAYPVAVSEDEERVDVSPWDCGGGEGNVIIASETEDADIELDACRL